MFILFFFFLLRVNILLIELKKFSSITKQLTMYGFRRDRLRNRLMFHENFVRTSALDTVSLPRKKENKSKQTQGNHTIIEDYPHLPGPDSMERGYNDLEKYNDAIFEQHILEFLDPSPETTLDAPLNIYMKPNSISDRTFGTELYSNSSVYPQVSIGKHVKQAAAVYDWSDPGFFSQI